MQADPPGELVRRQFVEQRRNLRACRVRSPPRTGGRCRDTTRGDRRRYPRAEPRPPRSLRRPPRASRHQLHEHAHPLGGPDRLEQAAGRTTTRSRRLAGAAGPRVATSRSTPRRSQARAVRRARVGALCEEAAVREAMFSTYGAWAASGPSPLVVQVSEPRGGLVGERRWSPGAGIRDEDLGAAGATSAALLDDAGGGFRPTAHVCAEPHSRKSWIVSP